MDRPLKTQFRNNAMQLIAVLMVRGCSSLGLGNERATSHFADKDDQ